jgi:type II secretory pathway pseudopilin PulG
LTVIQVKTTNAGIRAGSRGFTIMEILVSILVIFTLMGLLIVGARHVRKLARSSADRAAVTSLKQAVVQFRTTTGFLPPLVKDQTPLNTGRPSIYVASVPADGTALRLAPDFNTATPGAPDLRFSLYSIPYYVIGALDVPGPAPNPNNLPIDGVAGPGFLMPKRDGTFERAGRKFESFFDLGKSGKSLFAADAPNGRVVLRDANEVAFRYYRWLRGDAPNTGPTTPPPLNVPGIFITDLGPPKVIDPEFRSADFAIVGAGPNGVFGDEADLPAWHPQQLSWDALASKAGVSGSPQGNAPLQAKVRDAARADNIVEVGSEK